MRNVRARSPYALDRRIFQESLAVTCDIQPCVAPVKADGELQLDVRAENVTDSYYALGTIHK